MKTYDVYKLAIEEGKTRFKRKADGLVYRFDEDYALKLRPENQSDEWYQIKLDEEWEEVKEPIGFIGVLETLEESREESRWTVEDERYAMGMMNCTLGEILVNLGENYSDESIARILLNSDWYRED